MLVIPLQMRALLMVIPATTQTALKVHHSLEMWRVRRHIKGYFFAYWHSGLSQWIAKLIEGKFVNTFEEIMWDFKFNWTHVQRPH